MWPKIATWARKNWLWIALAVALVAVGVRWGWKLAAKLGGTIAVGGGAAKQLTGRQKEREAEGKRLEQERNDLQSEARETDVMTDAYYKRKGGPRQ